MVQRATEKLFTASSGLCGGVGREKMEKVGGNYFSIELFDHFQFHCAILNVYSLRFNYVLSGSLSRSLGILLIEEIFDCTWPTASSF